jgi:hypothetical protein
LPQALAELQKERDERWRLWALALYHHAAKNRDDSDRSLNQLIEKHRSGMDYQIAQVYAYCGQMDKAFEWMDNAYNEHDTGLLLLKGDPLIRSLHRDPRWRTLMKKMNFPSS